VWSVLQDASCIRVISVTPPNAPPSYEYVVLALRAIIRCPCLERLVVGNVVPSLYAELRARGDPSQRMALLRPFFPSEFGVRLDEKVVETVFDRLRIVHL